MAVDIPQTAIARGAGIALAVAIPVLLVSVIVDAFTDTSPGWLLVVFFLVLIVGTVAGGRDAGLHAPARPLTASVLSALAAFTVIAVLAVARLLVAGDLTADKAVALVLDAFLFMAFGLFGGVIAARRLAMEHIEHRTGRDDQRGRFR